jgi:F-type H+-transporting ATPase subunit epsilon
MAKTFKFDITTPDGKVFSGDVESLKVPGSQGSFGVLTDHAPFMTTTTIGAVEAVVNGQRQYFATSGGFVEVSHNVVTLLAETCEAAEDIDVERAKAALGRARQRLESRGRDVDIIRAQSALNRALNRIKISQFS